MVGRARESYAIAEQELLSSTSDEVCECWSGNAIVRVMGSPEILETIYIDELKHKKSLGLYTLDDERKLQRTLRPLKDGK